MFLYYVLIDLVGGPDGKIFGPRAKYFPVQPDLNSVNKHFIIWDLYTIHEHSEYEFWTKSCTEKLSNVLFAFVFLAVNNLDV